MQRPRKMRNSLWKLCKCMVALWSAVFLLGGCQSSKIYDENATTKSFKIVDGEKWTMSTPGGDGYAIAYTPPGKRVTIVLFRANDPTLPLGVSDSRLVQGNVQEFKRYIDDSLKYKKIGELFFKIGRVPVYEYMSRDPGQFPRNVMLYQTATKDILNVGFCYKDHDITLHDIEYFINKMYEAGILPKVINSADQAGSNAI